MDLYLIRLNDERWLEPNQTTMWCDEAWIWPQRNELLIWCLLQAKVVTTSSSSHDLDEALKEAEAQREAAGLASGSATGTPTTTPTQSEKPVA